MNHIIWLPSVREKLLQFRSEHFTSEETLDFILTLISEVEDLLTNKYIGQMYTEEFGPYEGLSRIIVRRFRFYYKKDKDNIIILAILFPGEN